MRITYRAGQVAANRDAQRQITGMFQAISERAAGILLAAAGDDGLIADLDGVKATIRAAIEPYFFERVPAGEGYQAELDHLDHLLGVARDDTGDRAAGRRVLLTQRRGLLITAGIMLAAIDRNGNGRSPYARIVLDGTEAATRSAITAHAEVMRQILIHEPGVIGWLEAARVAPPDLMRGHLPVTLWRDVRGYTLSDRIWNVGEATLARIDALLADGIAQGRAAVDIARDLERFLLPGRRGIVTRKPYGTIGSFDARRLARSEITRAASVSTYVSGLINPFVVRARYNLSGSHDPKNCDGSCDDHYAQDQANSGFEPDEVPIPMVDTHPQCMCYITHETAEHDQVINELRDQMGEEMLISLEPPPVTPLTIELLMAVLLGRINQSIIGANP